ncbi:hypothetical protein [Streptomyces albus]|uniref:hypothetical protein n=1 Tax=Streptomyces albus TaxID=1888 RepID=UPI0004C6C12C|nr:hypothetical protein [Streptomyces albus]
MSRRETRFTETMLGTVRLDGREPRQRIRLDLHARADGVLRPWATTRAELTGRVRITGLADDPHAAGELEISPLARRRIRYRLPFTAGDRRLLLDGWKSVTPARPLSSMTVLPFTLYEDGARVGEGTLRFPLATGLLPFLAGFRFPRAADRRTAGGHEGPEPAGSPQGVKGPRSSGRQKNGLQENGRYLAPRWDGAAGRTEVWYTTLTDPGTGTGIWLHHELTAPADGSPRYAHGWVAAFPQDGPVRHARFGPVPWPERTPADEAGGTPAQQAETQAENSRAPGHGPDHRGGDEDPAREPHNPREPHDGPEPHGDPPASGDPSGPAPDEGFTAAGVFAVPGRLAGRAGDFSWDLAEQAQEPPLFTFPRWSWRRPLLPAAQMLPAARAAYDGVFTYAGRTLTLRAAPGASARIYGHGNARRWAWLHADLGKDGVLEIVAAVSPRPALRRLPPLVFLRLRHGGRTWPRRAERSAAGWAGPGRFRARIGLPVWTVTGRAGLRRIRVEVTQPPERTIALEYRDPDGSLSVCRNSETADARILLERWWGHWRGEAEWTLEGTAHAEVGSR